MRTIKLTANDAQEVLHKIGILCDEPELQAEYGITQAQCDALVKSIPSQKTGGVWTVEDWAWPAVSGEMQDHAVILHSIAYSARNDNEIGQSLACTRQAYKFEKLFN